MVIRYVLCLGDKAGEAVILEGTGKTYRGRRLATVGVATYCGKCGQRGLIAPRGVRSANPERMLLALSGDINLCGCDPSPVFYAQNGQRVTFTAADVADWEAREQALAATSPMQADAAATLAEPSNAHATLRETGRDHSSRL